MYLNNVFLDLNHHFGHLNLQFFYLNIFYYFLLYILYYFLLYISVENPCAKCAMVHIKILVFYIKTFGSP